MAHQNIFSAYAETHQKIKELEAHLKELKPVLVAFLKTKPEMKASEDNVNIKLTIKEFWNYSGKVDQLKEVIDNKTKDFQEKMQDTVDELKSLQKAEQKSGRATVIKDKNQWIPRVTRTGSVKQKVVETVSKSVV